MRVEVDTSREFERATKLLAGIPSAVHKASWQAMSRAAAMAKTKAGQFAAARYQITKGTFMNNVNIKVFGEGTASMSVSFGGNVLPLKMFKTRTTPGGVMASVKDGGGLIPHTFIVGSLGGNVLERVGSLRLPLETKYGPSAAHMMQDEVVTEQMSQVIEENYEKRMEREITRILNGW